VQVLLIANTDDEDPGHVGHRLDDHGANFTVARRDAPGGLIGLPGGTDLVLLLGSAWSVYDPAHRASIDAEMALVRSAEAAGIATLGICFGAQLLAAAGGADVRRAPVPEIGWVTLDTEDSVLAPPGPWFQLHEDRWIPGPGAPEMARTRVGPQAFLRGRSLAWQFHPEVTSPTAAGWLDQHRDLVAEAGADPEALRADLATFAADAEIRCHRLVDAFLERVVGAVSTVGGPTDAGDGRPTSGRMAL
jgi:GMP synthase-like glutamine amidotransferase